MADDVAGGTTHHLRSRAGTAGSSLARRAYNRAHSPRGAADRVIPVVSTPDTPRCYHRATRIRPHSATLSTGRHPGAFFTVIVDGGLATERALWRAGCVCRAHHPGRG